MFFDKLYVATDAYFVCRNLPERLAGQGIEQPADPFLKPFEADFRESCQ